MPQVKKTDQQLADAMVMAAIRLTRTLRMLNRGAEYSGPQISALAVVAHAGRITARDLARLEEVTPATISRLLATLEDAGLVERAQDERDGRVQWISATAEGRRVIEQGHARRLAPLARTIAALPRHEREQMAAAVAITQRMIGELVKDRQ
jgi:DNA-binding MarR family transcriptional regulator